MSSYLNNKKRKTCYHGDGHPVLTSAWYLQGSTILGGHMDARDLREDDRERKIRGRTEVHALGLATSKE